MNLQQENEALKEACVKALESAKRHRLNLKEVLKENESLKQHIAALQREVQMLQNAKYDREEYDQRMLRAQETAAEATDYLAWKALWDQK